MSAIEDSGLFREPEKAPIGYVFLTGACLQFAIYGYYSVVHDFTGTPLVLILGSMFLSMALPEFLPKEHYRAAGVARITALGYSLIVATYFLVWY